MHEACEDKCVASDITCPVATLIASVPDTLPPMEEFQIEKLKFLLATLVEQSKQHKMQVDLYTECYEEFLKLFLHFGKAIKFAFADIQQKADEIRKCQKTLTKHYKLDKAPEGSDARNAGIYIEQMIQYEIEKELVMMNGDNNKKIIE